MPCEYNNSHNPEIYCDSCSTCHNCIDESNGANRTELSRLKSELQLAVDQRNEAWCQLEENNIGIRSPVT